MGQSGKARLEHFDLSAVLAERAVRQARNADGGTVVSACGAPRGSERNGDRGVTFPQPVSGLRSRQFARRTARAKSARICRRGDQVSVAGDRAKVQCQLGIAVINSVGFRAIIFSLNCFIAAMLALFIAFRLDLENPWWAMVTVYLTSQPLFSGALRARAVYRVMGTLIGLIAMVVIVPNLADSATLATAAISLWVAFCIYVSVLDRSPRAYALMLSGYTAALIGFPSVLNPDGVFDIAIARSEETVLGTVCAAVVHSLIFPRSVLSILLARQATVIADACRWIVDGLKRTPTPAIEQEQRRIARDVTELAILGMNLPYDTASQRPSQSVIRGLDERFVALLPLLSTIEDRIDLLRRGGALPAQLSNLVADIARWFEQSQTGDRKEAHRLRRACVAALPDAGPQSKWADLVTVSLLARLDELIETWQECLELAKLARDPFAAQDRRLRAIIKRKGAKPMHSDRGVAALSAVVAAIALLLCSAFWIATAWPQGATAVGIVAIVCSLFSSFDDPIPAMSSFTIGLVASVPLAFIYQFGILPAVDGFTLLVASLAPAFIPIGVLMAMPRYTLIGLPLAVGMNLNLALQTSYNADMAVFLNTSIAIVIGSLTGVAVTQLMHVAGAEAGARWLLRAGWRDLADLADRSVTPTRAEWTSRMLDRVGLLMPRLSRPDAIWNSRPPTRCATCVPASTSSGCRRSPRA
jgi:uncharacterized membrane protein YccC